MQTQCRVETRPLKYGIFRNYELFFRVEGVNLNTCGGTCHIAQAVIVSHYVPLCPLFSQQEFEVTAVSTFFFSSPSSDVTRGKGEAMVAKHYPPPRLHPTICSMSRLLAESERKLVTRQTVWVFTLTFTARVKTTAGTRAFPVAAPTLWNTLRDNITSAENLNCDISLSPKTYLFVSPVHPCFLS